MATARTAVTASHITTHPRVCGGRPCIDDTRIRVVDIAGLHKRGKKPEEMLHMYAVPLTLGQVHAALAYYYDHSEEIEASIKEDRVAATEIQRALAGVSKRSRRAL